MASKRLIGLFVLGVLTIPGYGLRQASNTTPTIKATVYENWTPFNLTSEDAMTIRILNVSTGNVTFMQEPGIIVSPVGGRYPSLGPIVTLYFDLNGSVYASFSSETIDLGRWYRSKNVTIILLDKETNINGDVMKSFEAPTEIEPVHYLVVKTTSVMMNATLQIEKSSFFLKLSQRGYDPFNELHLFPCDTWGWAIVLSVQRSKRK
ncbi:MAG: hypothetical protein J7L37_00560 [Thermococcus sp.]|nr:hypothetical protein [Thermococcus sp.]